MSIYRVLLVQLGSNWGGATVALMKVAETLRASGKFEPYLLFSADGYGPVYAREHGFQVFIGPIAALNCVLVAQPLSITSLIRFVIEFFPSIFLIKRLLSNLHIDFIYINTSPPVGAALAAKLQGIPIVWHVREAINHKFIGKIVAYCVKRFATVIVANSDYSGQRFQGSAKLRRVYDGVQLFTPASSQEIIAVRQKWEFGDENSIVGMISPVATIKGQHIFLDAIPQVLAKFPDAHFVIVGGSTIPDGYWKTFRGRLRRLLGQKDWLDILKNQAHTLGITSHLYFDGWCTDISVVLSSMDIIVFPSLIPEGFGRPQVEAGSAYKPIVSSDIGPARELVEDGISGILFPPGDAAALGKAVIALLSDKEAVLDMGQKGRERVEHYFSEQIHAREMLRVFEDLTTKHEVNEG